MSCQGEERTLYAPKINAMFEGKYGPLIKRRSMVTTTPPARATPRTHDSSDLSGRPIDGCEARRVS